MSVKSAFSAILATGKKLGGAKALARIGNKKHILLKNVPKSATPTDIIRMARRSRVENIVGATLDYHYFEPSGQAYLEISKSEFMLDALRILDNSSMMGSPMLSFPYDLWPIRQRGEGGRSQAAKRGILKGDGPAAGMSASGQEVIVIGIPARTTPDEFKAYLVENKLVEEGLDGRGVCEVLGAERPRQSSGQASPQRTRMYVKLKSASAAHELAKRLNMTLYKPYYWRQRMPLKARVLY